METKVNRLNVGRNFISSSGIEEGGVEGHGLLALIRRGAAPSRSEYPFEVKHFCRRNFSFEDRILYEKLARNG